MTPPPAAAHSGAAGMHETAPRLASGQQETHCPGIPRHGRPAPLRQQHGVIQNLETTRANGGATVNAKGGKPTDEGAAERLKLRLLPA